MSAQTGRDYKEGSVGPVVEGDADDGLDAEWREALVAEDQHGQRLDKVLVALAPEFSRSHLQSLIADGHVWLDGQTVQSASRRVQAGQALRAELIPTAQALAFRAEPMALPIVHEDDALLVINKPAGWVVHPAAGHWSGTLLNGLLAHHGQAATLPRAGIVHRLDKDTSGLMVVGKTLVAMTALTRDIAARAVQREYLALAHGVWPTGETVIDAPIGRDPRSRVRMAVVAKGKPARTRVERLAVASNVPGDAEALNAVSALRCTLDTGRTHQIRVHLASRGHPLLADALYGGRPGLGLQRQALHAARLGLIHPISGRSLSFEAALPPDLAQAWALCWERRG